MVMITMIRNCGNNDKNDGDGVYDENMNHDIVKDGFSNDNSYGDCVDNRITMKVQVVTSMLTILQVRKYKVW